MKIRLGKVKVCTFSLIVLLGITIFWAVSCFAGNPFTKLAAEKSVKEAINTKYNNMGLVIEDTVYDYTCGNYVVTVKSKSSRDSHFNFYCDKSGKIKIDDYNNSIINHDNTWSRVNKKYSAYVYSLMKKKLYYNFSNLEPSVNYDYRSELEMDKEYDVHDSALKGKIEAYIYTDELTWENLAKVTKEINDVLRHDGLNINSYTVGLCTKSDPVIKFCVNDFKSELLSSDNLPKIMEHYQSENK